MRNGPPPGVRGGPFERLTGRRRVCDRYCGQSALTMRPVASVGWLVVDFSVWT